MIYVIGIQRGKWIKIGFSDAEDISIRIAQSQTGNPFEITPIFTTFGTRQQELELHKALTTALGRVKVATPPNEWYPGHSAFMPTFLGYLKYGPNAAMAYLDNFDPAVNTYERRKPQDHSPRFRWANSSKEKKQRR